MRKWFTIPSLVQLILTIGLIGFFLIQAGISNSNLILKELQQQMLKQVNQQLTQRLQLAMQLNQINYDFYQHGILNLESQSERERYFYNILKSYPEAAMSFIGLADGSFYGARRTATGDIQVVRNNQTTKGASWYYRTTSSGEGIELVDQFPDFDPRKRPWFIKAEETGAPAFSRVYSHFIFREPTITASYPVYDPNNHLIGVFGVDYLLSWLGETLGSLPIGASGQVYVTDDAGMLIATSSDTPTFRKVNDTFQLIPAKETSNALIQASITLLDNEFENGFPRFAVDGKNYFVDLLNFDEYDLSWNIYVISAEDDFLGEVKKATTQTSILLVASLLFSILIATWIAGWVTKPIVKLSKAAEELANGNLITISDDGRKDELGKLTQAFNKMGLTLTNNVAILEKEVALRTQELKERNDELEKLSFLDSLTGIANRRHFDMTIKNAWQSAQRHKRPIALLMLDVDWFKNFNDVYGHQAGDECLRAIGNLLSERARRATDFVARYGGEEFVIILQDVEIEKIADYAEEIRKGIEGLKIEHSRSTFKHVTVSLGVAYMIPALETIADRLVEMADHALYQAKENGRNLVVISTNDKL